MVPADPLHDFVDQVLPSATQLPKMIGARQQPRTFFNDGGKDQVRHPRTSARVADIHSAIPIGKRKGIVTRVADSGRCDLAKCQVGVIRSGNQLVRQRAPAAVERPRRNQAPHVRVCFSNNPLISVVVKLAIQSGLGQWSAGGLGLANQIPVFVQIVLRPAGDKPFPQSPVDETHWWPPTKYPASASHSSSKLRGRGASRTQVSPKHPGTFNGLDQLGED